ncbi:MAG: ABC transporter permease [Verrucomicrobia bacterium]|nr:ABC transporter permease [Verrucomicrobiota bacterium]NBU09581.1 ABC transporter permease [Pseudomonadota bacterium]NDD39363.1 ABC transporter permease [Verrucomicrobiota bacterium]NDE99339.1 ABC transporter permease [Verrucomicrobiota bacterium]
MSSRSSTFSRLLADYGMVFVLALLCAFFSFATYTEQHPTSADAARQLANSIATQFGKSARVLIAVPNQPEAAEFAGALQAALTNAGATVIATVKGEPKEARAALQAAASAGKLDAIACTQASAGWLVFADLATDFPALGAPRVVQPQTYRWPNFLKRDNLLNIANQIAVIAIVAIGMTLVIIGGGIDLSVGSLIALAAVVAALLIRDFAGAQQATTLGMVLACGGAILVAGAAGAANGALVTVFHLPPFIVTLAMMLVASGVAYLLTHGQSVYQVPDSFVWLGRGTNWFGLPNAVLLMAVLYTTAHLVMSRTVLGRWLYAVGGNRQAARYSGVPVRRVLFLTYVISGLLAGLGGVVLASQLKSGSPTFGQMYELYVIAAVVVGGASLNGGTGRMFGTLVGAFTIAVIQNGMNLMNVESYTQKVVLGLVILGAVLLDLMRNRGWKLQLSAAE